jgi:MOSC domain-containing protein
MAGEDLREARVTFAGISGDRVYAFIDSKFGPPDFPWMTGRQGHDLILFRPRFLDAPPIEDGIPDADRFSTEVTTPEGEKFRMGDPHFTEYLAQRFKRSLRLRFSERSMTDARPLSIFSSATIRALSEETNLDLDARRFRANFYVEWENDAPFFEDSLVGREIQIGEVVALQVVKKDQRCVMITLDPETAASAPQVLARVSQNHDGCAGVYAAVLREGIVRVEYPIYLI